MTSPRPPKSEGGRRPAAWLGFALVYLATLAFVALSARGLPDPVASSFGTDGVAHGYMSRVVYARIFVGFSAVLPLVLVGALSWLPRRFPRLSRLPNQDAWLAPEHRAALFARLRRAGLLVGCASALFFAAMHALILQANQHTPPRLANGPFLAVLFAFLVATVGTALWLSLTLRAPPERA